MGEQVTYNPAVFEVADEAAARRIILTPEHGESTDARWAAETPYLADLITAQLSLTPGSLVLDYGCGIGRLSKALIERTGCRVIGVDISAQMRRLAADYVASPNFFTVTPLDLKALGDHGLRADAAISIWVLQHCLRPAADINFIRGALKPGGEVFIVNMHARAVPGVEKTWVQDGVDVRGLLNAAFDAQAEGALDPAVIPPGTVRQSFWGRYRQR